MFCVCLYFIEHFKNLDLDPGNIWLYFYKTVASAIFCNLTPYPVLVKIKC